MNHPGSSSPSFEFLVPVLQKDELFQEGSWTYRIPALLYIEKSRTILAFTEQRAGEKDESAKRIVMQRGAYDDAKCTVQWEPMQIVVENVKLDTQKACAVPHRPMNPCHVYDEVTGNVVLVFIAVEGNVSEQHQIDKKENKARLCQVTSPDNGVSWSSVKDLTNSDTVPEHWATFAVGPGHGLQLNNEVKSLVIPAHAYWISDDKQSTSPHPFCFVSDDHGRTWRRGNCLAENAGECQMVELKKEGKSVLYCNARKKGGPRVQAVSDTEGRDFKSQGVFRKLVEPPWGCHGSVIGFPIPAGVQSEQNTWVLYSHPTSSEDRKDLGLYLNKEPLNPESWTEPTVICQGFCAYSDLQYMGPGPEGSPLFCCLFEFGKKPEREKIIFFMFILRCFST